MLKINLRTFDNRHSLTAEDDSNYKIRADREGVGAWETFTLENITRTGGSLLSGDSVTLQTSFGKFVVAEDGGGGVVLANRNTPRAWETFIIRKVRGSGEIRHGDTVSFQANNRNYLAAVNGGGGEVLANGPAVGSWETFTFETWNTSLVHLKSYSNEYLTAEGGGGRELRANRDAPRTWETFTLINRSGRTDGFQTGDLVNFQVWNNKFVSADDRAVLAQNNRSLLNGLFTIREASGATNITHGDRVTFQASSNGKYLVAEDGGGREVLANRDQPRAWETFVLEYANRNPIFYSNIPSTSVVPGHPLSVAIDERTETKSILTLLIEYSDMPNPIDRTLTLDHIRDAMFGSGRSLKTWIELNSYGAASIANAGVHGPLKVPLPYENYREGSPAPPLSARRSSIGEWEKFTIELVGDRRGNIEHGSRVQLLAENNKYVTAQDGGGAFVFASTLPDALNDNAIFIVEKFDRSDGSLIGNNSYINLKTLSGFYVVAESGGKDLIKADRNEPRSWERFKIEKIEGDGNIQSGDAVAFKVNNGQYIVTDQIAFWFDVFNEAERQGVSLPALDRNSDGTITNDEVYPIVLDFSDVGGGASQRGRTVSTRGGITYSGAVIGMGLYLSGGPVQGADQINNYLSVIAHEEWHAMYSTPDRYYYRNRLVGDVKANLLPLDPTGMFKIVRVGGPGQIRTGDSVNIIASNDKYVVAERSGGSVINANRDVADNWEAFRIGKTDGSSVISHNNTITLQAFNNQYLVAEEGGGDAIYANSDVDRAWAHFIIERSTGTGVLRSGDDVAFKASNDQYFVTRANTGVTDPELLRKGYRWGNGCGAGVGGSFDITDDSCRNTMLSAFDRIKFGWIRPKVLTPENRSCYNLQPAMSNAEALILWDPKFPQERYIVENRLNNPDFDNVSSSGIIISWVSDNSDYWSEWEDHVPPQRFPVVISAAALNVPPNIMIAPVTREPLSLFKRTNPNAAFTSGDIILPRGDGIASRFHLSFHRSRWYNSFVVCIH